MSSVSVTVKDRDRASTNSSFNSINNSSADLVSNGSPSTGKKKKSVVRINFFGKGMEEGEPKKKRVVMDTDDFKLQTWFKLYMLIWWIPAIAITIWYIVQQTQQYQDSVANPTSSIIIETLPRLPLPQVTVCNWNQNSNENQPCPECELTLQSCSYNITNDCYLNWAARQFVTYAGTFNCYDFNPFEFEPMYSETTGYSGSYAAVFSVTLYPRTGPPDFNRSGVQVSFYAPGEITPELIYSEVRFAPIGYDSFYALQLITTIHTELPFFDPNYNTTAFDTPVTTVNLLSTGKKKKGNETIGYVGVTFAFQSLSQQTITFGVQYTLSSLFGDLASIIGTIMGIDVIKLSVCFCLLFISYKHKTFDFLADLCNG